MLFILIVLSRNKNQILNNYVTLNGFKHDKLTKASYTFL